MNVSDYTKAAIATMFIDMGLFYAVWTSTPLRWFDLGFVCVVLFSHIIFYFALYFDEEDLIETLHYFIFISLAVSIFLENTKLVIVCLGLLLIIQILWIVENRCILNNDDETNTPFGYSKELSIAVLLYTVILSIKLGRGSGGTTTVSTQ
jgi:hypothetical protein